MLSLSSNFQYEMQRLNAEIDQLKIVSANQEIQIQQLLEQMSEFKTKAVPVPGTNKQNPLKRELLTIFIDSNLNI